LVEGISAYCSHPAEARRVTVSAQAMATKQSEHLQVPELQPEVRPTAVIGAVIWAV
jgi:hypothetical protein